MDENEKADDTCVGSTPTYSSTLIVAISKSKNMKACAVYGVMEIAI
jgi:hypothetical protein